MVLKLAASSGHSMMMTLTSCAGAELKMLFTPLLMKMNLRERVVLLTVGSSQWIKMCPAHIWMGVAGGDESQGIILSVTITVQGSIWVLLPAQLHPEQVPLLDQVDDEAPVPTLPHLLLLHPPLSLALFFLTRNKAAIQKCSMQTVEHQPDQGRNSRQPGARGLSIQAGSLF